MLIVAQRLFFYNRLIQSGGKKMLKLYIVRHGKTLFNQKNLIQGWSDSPLCDEGINQAKALHYGLDQIPFKACYCSSLGRARQTAQAIIQEYQVPVYYLDELKEFNYGSLEGDSNEKLVSLYPIMLNQKVEGFDGETLEQLTTRMKKAIHEIALKEKEGNILVVTHSGSITALIKDLDQNQSLVDAQHHCAKVQNCSVTILEKKNQWKIVETNNTTFLYEGLEKMENNLF